MPIYEYRCDACGEDLEVTQRITADKLVECPACDEPKLRRLISRTSFTLKGSGWYATDYAKSSRKAEKKAEADEEKKAESKSSDTKDKKSDKKPDAGKESKPDAGEAKKAKKAAKA